MGVKTYYETAPSAPIKKGLGYASSELQAQQAYPTNADQAPTYPPFSPFAVQQPYRAAQPPVRPALVVTQPPFALPPTSASSASLVAVASPRGATPDDPLGLHLPPDSPDQYLQTPGAIGLRTKPQVVPRGPGSGPPTDSLTMVEALLSRIEQVTYLQLLSRGSDVVTDVTDIMQGSVIGANVVYQSFYTNQTTRPIAIQLFVNPSDWTNPGEGIRIALGLDGSDNQLIDVISNSANFRSESKIIILAPRLSIYVAAKDAGAGAVQSGTTIRGRLLDPQRFL